MALPLLAALAPSIIQGATGLAQAFTANKRKKERELESLAGQMPKYGGAPSISQYYQRALERSTIPALQTALYKQGQNLIGRNLATGLAATGVRPGGQGAVAGLVQGATDASMKYLTEAERLREQRFREYAQAANLKGSEEKKQFDINQMQPYLNKFNLLAQRAAQAAVQQGSGLSNLASAVTNAGRIFAAKYGDTSGLGTGKKKGSSSYPVDEFGELRLDDYGNKIG
jgi:hypothetical protein